MSHQKRIKDCRQLLHLHIRYLQKSREIQAVYGGATPPHVLIEIEDREIAVEELKRQLEELENATDEEFEEGLEFEEVKVAKSQLKTEIRMRLADEQVSLKKMLTELILEYLTETDDIEISFDPTQKTYRVVLLKGLTGQQDNNDESKRSL